MSRVIVGLSFARACPRPASIPLPRPRKKCKLAGIKYERELAKAISGANYGQWFEFLDRNGRGHCQTDLILEESACIFVFEAKYTWTEAGHRQIELLYRPVVEKTWGKPVFGVVVCKVLTRDTPRDWITSGFEAAKARAARGLPTVLHWIGGPLVPFAAAKPPSHLEHAQIAV